MAGISIPIAADTKGFQAGVDNVVEGLAQVAKEADQVTAAGDKAGVALEESLRGAQAQTEPVVGGFQRITEEAKKTSAATEEIGTTAREVGAKTEEGGKLGEAALMNLGYSASTAGEAFTGPAGLLSSVGTFAAFLGPALPLGLGAAVTVAGVGLAALGQVMGKTKDDTAEITKEVADLVNELLGSASGANAFDEGLRKWAKDASDFGGVALKDLAADSEKNNLNFYDLASAITSHSLPALEKQKGVVDELIKSQNARLASSTNLSAADVKGLEDQRTALQTVKGALDTNITAQKQAQEATEIAAKSLGKTIPQYKAYEDAVSAAQTASDDFTTNLDGSIKSAGQNLSSFVKNGVVDLKAWEASIIAAAKGAADTVLDINRAMGHGMTTAGQQYAESLGPAFGQAYDQAKREGSHAVAALVKTMNEAGAASGRAYGEELKDKMPKTVSGPRVIFSADTGHVDNYIKNVNGKTYTAYIDFVPRGGKRVT